jgi:type II secretory pathway component PulF
MLSNIQSYVATALSSTLSDAFVRFSTKDRVLFAKRLAFLMNAGVSMYESMQLLRSQFRGKRLHRIFDTITDDIGSGKSLARSLTPYQSLFGPFTIKLIDVGETVGTLPENLSYIADVLYKKALLEQKIRSALIYPFFIAITTLGVTSGLIMFIFPKIMPIFISLQIPLPWTTKALMATSTFLIKWWWAVLLFIVICVVSLLILYARYLPFRHIFQKIYSVLPVTGTLTRLFQCATTCRILGITLRSGLPLSEATFVTADAVSIHAYTVAYKRCGEELLTGKTLSTTLRNYPRLFPVLIPDLVLIGEQTGRLSETLLYLSDLYESELESYTKNLSQSLEPFLLLTMGLIIGVIAVSVVSPIYEITKFIGVN